MAQQNAGPQLTYDADSEMLRTEIGEKGPQTFKAYSGGSRGHKLSVTAKQAKMYLHEQAKGVFSHLATTPELKNTDGSYKQRGGTLPAGHYSCIYLPHHHTFKECIRLVGMQDTKEIVSPFASMPIPVSYRGGFFIHGAGPKGSDGCIVISSKAELHYICSVVHNFPGQAILLVKNVGYQLPAEHFLPGLRSAIG